MGDRAEALAESGDGVRVGEVDVLGADARLVGVGGRQFLLVPARGDHMRALLLGGQADGAGEPAAPPDHQHGLIFQRSGHVDTLRGN